MLGRADANRSFLVVETQKGPSMRFANSIFASLLKPINRKQFQKIVDEHDGDSYDKTFKSWDHLVALVYAQLAGINGLRALEATFNDVEIGRDVPIKAGTTYVFDKGYCRFDWWQKINDSKAFFVTRKKVNMRLRAVKHRTNRKRKGDGFNVIADDEVVLASKSNARLPIPLRRIKIRREKGGVITLLTNDLARTAIEIAALYKSRWQIELLFRWIKQHLDIRKFLGRNDNAIRLQVLAAMIAYLLLRIAARVNCTTMLPLRLAELVSQFLFTRRSIATITKPPPINPSNRQQRISPNQLELCYG